MLLVRFDLDGGKLNQATSGRICRPCLCRESHSRHCLCAMMNGARALAGRHYSISIIDAEWLEGTGCMHTLYRRRGAKVAVLWLLGGIVCDGNAILARGRNIDAP